MSQEELTRNDAQTLEYDQIRTSADIAMEKALAEAKRAEEEEMNDEKEAKEIAAYMGGSLFQKIKFLTLYLKKNKAELIIGILFIMIAGMLLLNIRNIGKSIWYLDTGYSLFSVLPALLFSVLPFLLWIWSTKYALFQFYKFKRLIFRLCILNASVLLWQVILKAEMKLLLPLVFLIPTYGGIAYSTVVLSAYMFLIAIFIVPFFIVTYKYMQITYDNMTDRWVTGFYIKNYLPDNRPNKKFAYDMRYVKRLDSFSRTQVIYENDRFLHGSGVGSTGTGKTSTIGTVVYESDLQQKAYNTDYQKQRVVQLLEQGKARMTRYFEDIDFNIDYIVGVGEDEEETNKELAKLKLEAASAGFTMFCPNAAFADELYQIAKAKGFRVNRVDPMPDEKTGQRKEEYIGFNPIYVPLEDSSDKERYLDKVFTAAKLYSDVNQAVFELSGKGDPYFTSLNRSLSVTVSVTLIITVPHVHPGRYATPEDVQFVINNFEEIAPYRDKLIELYGEKNEAGRYNKDIGKAKVGCGLQFILSRIDRDMLGPNAAKISEQATGLRNIIDDSLMNPKIKRILCAQETIDLDRILEKGEITLVNFEISLDSDSTGFGMFVLLSFGQAVLRRKGTAKTRIPHFSAIDEAPKLFHPKIETFLTIFRQYRCAMLLFIQSLSQFEKSDTMRYLKQVMIGNCATQIWFGRASIEEMMMFNRLAGKDEEVQSSTSTRETALSDENTQMAMSTSYSVEEADRYSTTDVRYRQFLECSVMTVRDSTPLPPFVGKVNFLPKYKMEPIQRYVVDWSKYYREPETGTEELVPVVTASTEVSGTVERAETPAKKKGLLSAGSVEASIRINNTFTKGDKEADSGGSVYETPLPQTQKHTGKTEKKENFVKEKVTLAEEELFSFDIDE